MSGSAKTRYGTRALPSFGHSSAAADMPILPAQGPAAGYAGSRSSNSGEGVRPGPSLAPHHEQFLDFGDRLGRVQVLRAGLGAVHDCVAAVKPERVFEGVESVAGLLVATVG